MARQCEICDKKSTVGNRITRRGLAKAKGGIGKKVTSRTRRTFKPNIQKVRVLKGKTPVRVKICARCLKAGKVQKRTS